MRTHITETFPGQKVKYFSSEEANYFIPDLNNPKIRKNFMKDLFKGLNNSLENADSFWKDVHSFFCIPHELGDIKYKSYSDFLFMNFRNPLVLQTQRIGWNRNGWKKEGTGEELYSPFFAGRNDLLKIQEIEDKGVIVSVKKSHTIPFDFSFVEETLKKYSGQKIDEMFN